MAHFSYSSDVFHSDVKGDLLHGAKEDQILLTLTCSYIINIDSCLERCVVSRYGYSVALLGVAVHACVQ